MYDVIIAHGIGCNDGALSAWCIWNKLPSDYKEKLILEGGFYNINGNSEDYFNHPNRPKGAHRLQQNGHPVVFVFIQPKEQIPIDLISNKRVLILDLDMGKELLSVVEHAKSTMLIDHHHSSNQTLATYGGELFSKWGNKFASLIKTDVSDSGVTLTWKYFYDSSKIHPLIDIIRIGDTWQWNDNTDAEFIINSLNARNLLSSFTSIDKLMETWDEKYLDYLEEGKQITAIKNHYVNSLSQLCNIGNMETNDGKIYTVAFVQGSILLSEVGVSLKSVASKLYNVNVDFSAVWKYVPSKNIITVSFRDPNDGIDLSQIAKDIKHSNGKGGGHIKASAFAFFDIKDFSLFIKPLNYTNKNNKYSSQKLEYATELYTNNLIDYSVSIVEICNFPTAKKYNIAYLQYSAILEDEYILPNMVNSMIATAKKKYNLKVDCCAFWHYLPYEDTIGVILKECSEPIVEQLQSLSEFNISTSNRNYTFTFSNINNFHNIFQKLP